MSDRASSVPVIVPPTLKWLRGELDRALMAVQTCGDRVWLYSNAPITTEQFCMHRISGGFPPPTPKQLEVARRRLRQAGLVRVYNTRPFTWDWPGAKLSSEKKQKNRVIK